MRNIVRMIKLLFILPLAVCAKEPDGIWDNFTFYSEEYPPYNYTEDGSIKGIAVDLLLETAKNMDSPINIDSIKVMPWARSYRTVLAKPNTVLFSTARTPLREELFHWVGPIASTRIVVLSKIDANIKIENVEQLRTYRIGVIIDDVGEQQILTRGVPEQNIENSNSASALAHMLEFERIDLWAYEEQVALSAIYEAGYKPSDYNVSFVLDEIDLYFALNIATPQSVIDAFQSALDALKVKENAVSTSNVYEAITNKYQHWSFEKR